MKPSTSRLVSFTLALVMILGALFIFFDLIQPAYQTSQATKGQIAGEQTTLTNEQNATKQIQNLLNQYHGDQDPESAVSNALPLVNDQAGVVHELQALAVGTQLAMQSLAVTEPGAKPVTKQSIVQPVGVITAQFRVSGTYENFRTFLGQIESNIRLTDVQSLVIAPVGKPNQDFYTFDLTISNYYQNAATTTTLTATH